MILCQAVVVPEDEDDYNDYDDHHLLSHKNGIQQDKVNYAVYEREDRVTGATTLTRMAGCNRMYWAATVLC